MTADLLLLASAIAILALVVHDRRTERRLRRYQAVTGGRAPLVRRPIPPETDPFQMLGDQDPDTVVARLAARTGRRTP